MTKENGYEKGADTDIVDLGKMFIYIGGIVVRWIADVMRSVISGIFGFVQVQKEVNKYVDIEFLPRTSRQDTFKSKTDGLGSELIDAETVVSDINDEAIAAACENMSEAEWKINSTKPQTQDVGSLSSDKVDDDFSNTKTMVELGKQVAISTAPVGKDDLFYDDEPQNGGDVELKDVKLSS